MIGLNTAAVYVLQTLGSLYLLIVLLRFVLQLVRANFYNPLCQFVVKATQPLLKPLRRWRTNRSRPDAAAPGCSACSARSVARPARQSCWRR